MGDRFSQAVGDMDEKDTFAARNINILIYGLYF